VELLEEGPVSPSSISTVVLSHIHFDHVGDPNRFPSAVMLAGPGSKDVSGVGWPRDPRSPFLSSVTEHPHYQELSFETDAWALWGPFARAYDFFGDGSFYLVDTPGHLPGHMGGVALTGVDEWVVMGGDCCHHRSLLMHTRPMSVTCGPAGPTGFHLDPDSAKKTVGTIRKLEKESKGSVLVALAHDSYLRGRMPEYPKPLNGFQTSEWKKDLDRVLQKDYASV
jgi:glyoxylase-like metal-dependent hydrolase (beta-lactamase superfamily II)